MLYNDTKTKILQVQQHHPQEQQHHPPKSYPDPNRQQPAHQNKPKVKPQPPKRMQQHHPYQPHTGHSQNPANQKKLKERDQPQPLLHNAQQWAHQHHLQTILSQPLLWMLNRRISKNQIPIEMYSMIGSSGTTLIKTMILNKEFLTSERGLGPMMRLPPLRSTCSNHGNNLFITDISSNNYPDQARISRQNQSPSKEEKEEFSCHRAPSQPPPGLLPDQQLSPDFRLVAYRSIGEKKHGREGIKKELSSHQTPPGPPPDVHPAADQCRTFAQAPSDAELLFGLQIYYILYEAFTEPKILYIAKLQNAQIFPYSFSLFSTAYCCFPAVNRRNSAVGSSNWVRGSLRKVPKLIFGIETFPSLTPSAPTSSSLGRHPSSLPLAHGHHSPPLPSPRPATHPLLAALPLHLSSPGKPCMGDPDVDHEFLYDEQGRVDILQSPFFDVTFGSDRTADEYVDRIIYQLTLAIEDRIPQGRWYLIGHPSTPPNLAPNPATTTRGVLLSTQQATRMRMLKGLNKTVSLKAISPSAEEESRLRKYFNNANDGISENK
ncbi:hypothetical protein M5K25_010240 [Dendrobium thyrsiflorum]|uniref:Uncharacterized protein n=1 Tax=Dendrobium thyrsiflorum TaxID=117978 RepID=A0ABD0UZI7_DENTH